MEMHGITAHMNCKKTCMKYECSDPWIYMNVNIDTINFYGYEHD